MKERPILFSGPMVCAILEGRKTQTRRVARHRDFSQFVHDRALEVGVAQTLAELPSLYCPYGQPGDWLWVRETFLQFAARPEAGSGIPDNGCIDYRANMKPGQEDAGFDSDGDPYPRMKWRPSIHMPRWASRILLEIVSVRVERVQDISEEDAIAEGITGPHDVGYPAYWCPGDSKARYSRASAAYESLWDSINSQRGFGWDANPWVWVIEFKRVAP